jgi:hypothetical protein
MLVSYHDHGRWLPGTAKPAPPGLDGLIDAADLNDLAETLGC